jgi:hypothetical protein
MNILIVSKFGDNYLVPVDFTFLCYAFRGFFNFRRFRPKNPLLTKQKMSAHTRILPPFQQEMVNS